MSITTAERNDLAQFENEFRKKGYTTIAGVDEAGRGPLAGPVVAAACILPQDVMVEGIDDSKKLTPKKRDVIFEQLINHPQIEYRVSIIDAETIDEINILQATLLAMKNAVLSLSINPDFLLIDGNQYPRLEIPALAIPKGDSLSISIGAASIIAKVTRDRLMDEYHEKWPEFEFVKHKGYGTKFHREAIVKYGPCPIHRNTFEPIKSFLSSQ